MCVMCEKLVILIVELNTKARKLKKLMEER
jgi:hypothetical protein